MYFKFIKVLLEYKITLVQQQNMPEYDDLTLKVAPKEKLCQRMFHPVTFTFRARAMCGILIDTKYVMQQR